MLLPSVDVVVIQKQMLRLTEEKRGQSYSLLWLRKDFSASALINRVVCNGLNYSMQKYQQEVRMVFKQMFTTDSVVDDLEDYCLLCLLVSSLDQGRCEQRTG